MLDESRRLFCSDFVPCGNQKNTVQVSRFCSLTTFYKVDTIELKLFVSYIR